MPKPKMKATVPPELRRNWLRLIDEQGKTVPEIHDEFHYDVRTIRKAVQWARDDREQREARRLVYRQALEAHYADIVAIAEELDSELLRDKCISPPLTNNRLWKSMRQHLPRSPMWQVIKKLEDINAEIRNLEEELGIDFDTKVSIEPRLLLDSNGLGLNRDVVSRAFVHRVKTNDSVSLRFFRHKPGILGVAYGPHNLGFVPENDKGSIAGYIESLLSVPEMETCSEKLKGKLTERQQAVDTISEELATIRLKRILTGKCKYCPL